jgi:MinD superfamily P-loop ATPase
VGPGDYDLGSIEIVGELKPLHDFKLPPISGEAIIHNEAVQELLHNRTVLRPQVEPELCSRCGTCIEQGPVSVLSMGDDLPQVDADTCISCFCCQEICSEKAVILK